MVFLKLWVINSKSHLCCCCCSKLILLFLCVLWLVPAASRCRSFSSNQIRSSFGGVREAHSKEAWPPAPSPWRHPRPVNRLFGSKMQLYSKTHQHLAIYPNCSVRGTEDETDLHTYLQILPVGKPELVKIKGTLTNLYLAMDERGRLHAVDDPNDDSTVFVEKLIGSYNTYMSKKYEPKRWYIGLKKTGKFRPGRKTRPGQKATMFLPRRSRFE